MRVLFVLFFLVLSGCASHPSVEINGENIFVEIADEVDEREKGLMFREELCNQCGMLFVFENPAKPSFWMKNTLIPLDILFIDEKGLIVEVVSMEPCVEDVCDLYTPAEPVLFVLEVNKGYATAHGITPGVPVSFIRTFK